MPAIHHFTSTGEAYNASQTREEIRDGDVLVVRNELVVGVMISAWPTAITEEHGEFHLPAPELDWTAVERYDGETRDYTESLELAKAAVEAMEDSVLADDRELRVAADELGIDLPRSSRVDGIELKRAARELGLAEELGIDLEPSVRVPTIKVGDRVEVVRGTFTPGLIGEVRLLQNGVNPSTRNRLFAYIALDDPEPGIGHFMSVPVENLERVAGEVV